MRTMLAAAAMLLLFAIPARADTVTAFVSILPQKYFLEKVGGKHVDVQVMVQPGASPAIYEPKPRQMAQLDAARVYFAIGVPFERAWLPRFAAANRDMLVVQSHEGITRAPIDGHDHGHGHGHGEHAHDGHAEAKDGIMDPHVWLAPQKARIIAANMRKALAQVDPDNAADYAANLEAFHKECDDLDATLHEMLGALEPPHNAFMVFHPSWGYFARAYGLRQIAIEIEGKEPSPAELKHLIEEARHEGVHVIFVQPQFSRKSAELVARSIDGRVAPLDPLAEDWHKNLLHAAEAIVQAVQQQVPPAAVQEKGAQ